MTEWHLKSKRKPTGGMLKTRRRSDKKLYWKGGPFLGAVASEDAEDNDVRVFRGRGGAEHKYKMAYAKFANVSEPGTNKVHKASVEEVVLNPANQHFTRRNIITKGTYIKVEVKGKKHIAKVTSKPGRAGAVNSVLLTEQEEKDLEQKIKEGKKKKKATKPKKEEKPAEKKEFTEEKPEEEKPKEKSEAELDKEVDQIIEQAEKK